METKKTGKEEEEEEEEEEEKRSVEEDLSYFSFFPFTYSRWLCSGIICM